MEKGVVIGFLISLAIIISLGLFFNLSNKNLYLGQISSSLREFGKLNYEIQNLKKEISNLKEEIEKEKKEREEIEGEVLSFSQNFKKQGEVKEKSEKPKEVAICQKKENDFPRHRVIFNEICWMGDEESPTNEWIEIKNVSKDEIDLSGWQILNKNQKLKFVFEEGAKILPSEILLLKRGDDFSGAIKNSDEALFLFDKNCNLEDEVFATSSWPAGDNFSKRTAERKNDLSWQTSLDPGGTPGKENSPGFVEIEKEEEEKEPKISLDFPKEIFTNQEFKVSLSVSNLENETYDIKISILKISDESEQKRTISEISLTGEEWQSSYKYLSKVFSGTSFSGDFKLRISQKYQDFKGEAEILAKVRQSSNRKVALEFKDKIKIKEIEIAEKTPTEATPEETTSETQPLPETSSQVSFKVLINEIQIDSLVGVGGSDDDWVELYNPNDFDVSLGGWSIQKHSANQPAEACSIDKSFYKKSFPQNAIIPAKGFYLIVSTQASDGLKNLADMTIGWSLSANNTIYLVRNQEKIENGDDPDIIDKVGFGLACFPEKEPFLNPPEGKSIQRKELGLDTDINSQDFEINDNPTPTNSKGETLH
jgi:hypothetical protein